MARARNIKPGFFKNEDLAECSLAARLCFAGLWTLADREGRLEDRPKRIKGELFAFDSVEVEPLLIELQRHGFIERYTVQGLGCIQVVAFHKHQNPHHREPESELPPPQSPGLAASAIPPKPQALSASDGGKAQGQPRASPRLEGDESAKDGGQAGLNPVTGFRSPDSPFRKERASVSPPPPPRAHEEEPPETNGHAPTPAGGVCRAIRAAGFAEPDPGDARLLALLEQGATEVEFVSAATDAAEQRKGWGWLLGRVKGRRKDAAAIALAPAVTAPADTEYARSQGYLAEQAAYKHEPKSPEVRAKISEILAGKVVK